MLEHRQLKLWVCRQHESIIGGVLLTSVPKLRYKMIFSGTSFSGEKSERILYFSANQRRHIKHGLKKPSWSLTYPKSLFLVNGNKNVPPLVRDDVLTEMMISVAAFLVRALVPQSRTLSNQTIQLVSNILLLQHNGGKLPVHKFQMGWNWPRSQLVLSCMYS